MLGGGIVEIAFDALLKENSWAECATSRHICPSESSPPLIFVFFPPLPLCPPCGYFRALPVLNAWSLLLHSFSMSSQCILCPEHVLGPNTMAEDCWVRTYFASHPLPLPTPPVVNFVIKGSEVDNLDNIVVFYNPSSCQTHFRQPHFIAWC